MAKAARARVTRRGSSLPEEIVVWEILVRLPPKSILRCRAVCRAWRRATSARDFLLAHHGRQPSLPVVYERDFDSRCDIFALDRRAAAHQLQPVAQISGRLGLAASCHGLLLLSTFGMGGHSFSVCNPVTRQHAPVAQLPCLRLFSLLGMYLHHPTGEYRLLLHRGYHKKWEQCTDLVGCYVQALGSDQPLRFIGGPKSPSLRYKAPVLLHDNLHWYPMHDQSGDNPQTTESKPVIVFDTVAESFRNMHAPVVPTTTTSKPFSQANPYIFEMDGTLGMYTCNRATEIVDIWVLQDYECEAWEHKYRVELPLSEIRGQYGGREIMGPYGGREDSWYVRVLLGDGDVPLLLSYGQRLFCVDTDGKLVGKFHPAGQGQQFHACHLRLKQTLVAHNFFTALEGHVVNTSPFS